MEWKTKLSKLLKNRVDIYLSEVRFIKGYQGMELYEIELEQLVEKIEKSAYQRGKKDGAKKLADDIVDNIDEFGDDPKQALACVSETINLWSMTPEQQREYNEGHDY